MGLTELYFCISLMNKVNIVLLSEEGVFYQFVLVVCPDNGEPKPSITLEELCVCVLNAGLVICNNRP